LGVLAPEHDGVDLGFGVFKRKIEVTRGRNAEIRNFAGDPDERKGIFQKRFYLGGQFRNAQDVPFVNRRNHKRLIRYIM